MSFIEKINSFFSEKRKNARENQEKRKKRFRKRVRRAEVRRETTWEEMSENETDRIRCRLRSWKTGMTYYIKGKRYRYKIVTLPGEHQGHTIFKGYKRKRRGFAIKQLKKKKKASG